MHTYYQGGFVSLFLVCNALSLHWVVILLCVVLIANELILRKQTLLMNKDYKTEK